MSEERVRKLSRDLAEKQIWQANLKREKSGPAEIVTLDADIMRIKREINMELLALSQEVVHEIDVETDDTQRNR
jgi:hypothetical protein